MSDTLIHEVADLTTATNDLITAVGTQQTAVNAAVAAIAATTNTVDNNLNNVDNTSDADKPVSTAQQTEVDTKQDTLISGTNISTVNGESLLTGAALVIERGQTEIAAIDYEDRGNLRDTLLAAAGDSVVVDGIGLVRFITTQDEPDDDETSFNVTTGGQFLLELPAFDLLSAYDLIDKEYRNDLDEDEVARITAIVNNL
jgi:hypothetical protein